MRYSLFLTLLFFSLITSAQVHSSFNKNSPTSEIPSNPGVLCECPPTIYPWIISQSPITMSEGQTVNLTVTGYYFDETSQASSAGFTVNTTTVDSPEQITLSVTATTSGTYDLVVSNFCAYDTLVSSFTVVP